MIDEMDTRDPSVSRRGNRIIMPGMASVHSHAFQRALRGRTQRRATEAGSFWSWRRLMYTLAERLDPDDLFHISRFAFVELAMSGVTAVGEFHYLHHDRDGTPYEDRTLLAETVIRAAREAGLRIALIRTGYFRAGWRRALEPAQRRFCDASVEDALRDVETLQRRFAGDPMVRIGLAAHSVRAVPRPYIMELMAYARERALPFHMHVSEQRREVDECIEEYGLRPVALLDRMGVLGEQFVAVHATHLDNDEIRALGGARAFVCLCRTTERDLGDGFPPTRPLVQAGARLCVGADSHASSDAFEEIRAVELDERSRLEVRHAVAEAPELLRAATQHGYQAIGMGDAWRDDWVALNADDPSLASLNEELLIDGLIFAATPRAVDEVTIAGREVVIEGTHIHYEEARRGYEMTLRKLGFL